jgi:hypothetical protein
MQICRRKLAILESRRRLEEVKEPETSANVAAEKNLSSKIVSLMAQASEDVTRFYDSALTGVNITEGF